MGRTYAEKVRLIRFAEEVLALLEEEKEWSSDTLSEIAAAAVTERLATHDDEGMFRAFTS